jgi:uncharacterized protein (DUF1501 family)
MLVPHGDPHYHDARPHLAIPARRVVDLDGYFGLHRGLAPLKRLWDNGSLAVIPAAGVPGVGSSHFAAQARLETGGWLDRSCRPRAPLDQALAQIARLIKTDTGIEIAFVADPGWDTHLSQGADSGRLSERLHRLGRALATFADDLGERLRDVVVVTLSEFGRTVGENRTLGTDHGRATAMLVLGGPVNGGRLFGPWPGLVAGDGMPGLPVTRDVRDILAEVATRHLRHTHAPAFPDFTADPSRFPGVIRT